LLSIDEYPDEIIIWVSTDKYNNYGIKIRNLRWKNEQIFSLVQKNRHWDNQGHYDLMKVKTIQK